VTVDSEPRWLDVEQMDAWLGLVGVLIKLPAALDTQLQRDSEVSHFEYQVLAGLSEAPERTLRMSTIAQFANGSLSRLSHVVQRLEDRGWVRRVPCPEDRRATNAVLTDAGYAKVVDTAPGHVETVRRLVIDVLTPAQLAELCRIATAVVTAIEEDPAFD
jgi:DNA-binding MarR family transcriptional regulator